MEQIEIEVKQNPENGKWNAWVALPTHNSYRSEDFDSESDAIQKAESLLGAIKEVLGEKMGAVKRSWGGYGGSLQ